MLAKNSDVKHKKESTPIKSLPPRTEGKLRVQWQHCAKQAHQAYKLGQTKSASVLFTECVTLSEHLLLSSPNPTNGLSGIELLYFSSHNLAACQNKLHLANTAKENLQYVYDTCIWLCEYKDISRTVKLDALATLDKILFSLCSQLAYMAQDGIHDLIITTDLFAQRIQKTIHLAA